MKFNGEEVTPGDLVAKNSRIDLVLGDGNGAEKAKDTLNISNEQ
jgi:hypothetical protein